MADPGVARRGAATPNVGGANLLIWPILFHIDYLNV